MAKRAPSRLGERERQSARRRRNLLFAVVAVLGLGSLALLFLGHGKPAAAPVRVRQVAVAHARKSVKAPVKKAARVVHVGRQTTRKATKKYHPSAQHRYAAKIAAILDQSTQLFDRTVAAVGNASGDALSGTCLQYGQEVTLAAAQFDGVAHPGPWYKSVGWMHHSIMGVYHSMAGALQACQVAADNQDDQSIAIAKGNVSAAAHQMQQTDQWVHWLKRRP